VPDPCPISGGRIILSVCKPYGRDLRIDVNLAETTGRSSEQSQYALTIVTSAIKELSPQSPLNSDQIFQDIGAAYLGKILHVRGHADRLTGDWIGLMPTSDQSQGFVACEVSLSWRNYKSAPKLVICYCLYPISNLYFDLPFQE
jgi:hypothetical protein